jgi:hypothetical protein
MIWPCWRALRANSPSAIPSAVDRHRPGDRRGGPATSILAGHIDDMKESQKLRFAGKTPGGTRQRLLFFAPHIIELDRAEALTREVFGPVLHVVRYKAKELDGCSTRSTRPATA